MNISCSLGAVAVVVIAATGYGDGRSAIRRTVVASDSMTVPLNLNSCWARRSIDPIAVGYSAVGWDDVPVDDGATVTLEVLAGAAAPHVPEGGDGLSGRGTYVWHPSSEAMGQMCTMRHTVVRGGAVDPDETLVARFAFSRELRTEEEVAAVIYPDARRPCEISVSGANWLSTGRAGDGIAAPVSEMATVTFAFDWAGPFDFEYRFVGEGALTVVVDGGERRTLDPSVGWVAVRFGFDSVRAHTVVLSASGDAAIRNVRWGIGGYAFGSGRRGSSAVDLREGVLVVRQAQERLPFTWSSTNFTGVVASGEVDLRSVASVRVVQVTGEGEDVSQWTAEVSGTAKTLVAEKKGEGKVRWTGVKPGVWKAEFVIRTDGGEVHCETRILDLRKYVGQGLVFFVT